MPDVFATANYNASRIHTMFSAQGKFFHDGVKSRMTTCIYALTIVNVFGPIKREPQSHIISGEYLQIFFINQ